MDSKIDRPEGHPTQEPVFVPKQDNQVALDIDECLDLIVAAQEQRTKIQKRIDNLKAVAKQHMKAKGVEVYESDTGRKAQFYSQQQPKYDRDKMRELLGEDYAGCLRFETQKRFKVT